MRGGALLVTDRRAHPLDAQRILEALARHEVNFVLVGGMAAQTHGNTRMTNDVDVIPQPDPLNLARLAEALRALGARVLNTGHEDTEIDATMLPRATIWQLATPHGDIDVLHKAPGAAPYDQLRERALVITLDDLRIPVVGRDDLIRMKLARGRPVDRADVAALTDFEADSSRD
ncbi:MAG TPA: DUF6036 family nucleotidyltransferase [Solirubrobacterales bacterium]|nr:DUF6036 family nucleotidyltransferase [Solirubrobacterales bacterium]